MTATVDVLAVFAHPDDETFGPGGTLAKLTRTGRSVHLLTMTCGEAGTIDKSAAMGRRNLAALRRHELRTACAVLGIEGLTQLHLPDSGLIRLEEETLLRPIVGAIRRYRPRLVMTFHGDGISGHPDHRTVTRRVKTGFDLAMDPGCWPDLGGPHAAWRLWTYAVTREYSDRVTWRKLHAVDEEALSARVDVTEYVAVKRAAVAAHASQAKFIRDLEEQLGDLEFWNREGFTLERGEKPGRLLDDLDGE